MRVRGFGELEAVIMDRLWTRNAVSTVRDIFDDLSRTAESPTPTVMSTMDNLHLGDPHPRAGRQAYHYRPVMTREEYSATLMRASFDPRGDTDLVLTHFLEQMPAEESARVQDALRRIILMGSSGEHRRLDGVLRRNTDMGGPPVLERITGGGPQRPARRHRLADSDRRALGVGSPRWASSSPTSSPT